MDREEKPTPDPQVEFVEFVENGRIYPLKLETRVGRGPLHLLAHALSPSR